MINNKNQFKKANKSNIIIKRIYNLNKDNKIKEGEQFTILKEQSNAFILSSGAWVYYDTIEVSNNQYCYYEYIPDNKKELYFGLDCELIKLDDKEYKDFNKNNNYNYTYKVKTMINEIIEVQ
jgi:hypothetical protein